MKNKKINITTAVLTLGLIIILASAFNKQQTADTKFLTMRTFESNIPAYDSRITIVYEDNKFEEIPLEKWKQSNWTGNLQKINETLNKLSAKGYQLVATSGTDGISTTYTFMKK